MNVDSAANGPWPDEGFAEGSVIDGSRRGAAFDLAADYVVVGTGAAGAVAGHTLAQHGHSVLFLEEGPWVKTRHFSQRVERTFSELLRDGGLQAMRGRAFIPLLQGRCVGGSTVVNSAIAWRLPDDVLHMWQREHGLDALTAESLDPHYRALETALQVRETPPDVRGENNRMFLDAAARLGIEARAMHRYDAGCRGSSRCMQGCPSAAKQGMNVSMVPEALRLGARLVHDCRVEHVIVRGGRAVGVRGLTKAGAALTVHARRGVLVAASTVQTPGLLRRSGLRHAAIGANFQAHPGHGLAGRFDHPVQMDVGATQGAESIHFRQSHGFKLETLAMPPELAAARVPGVGQAFSERMRDLHKVAVWVVQFRSEAKGKVTRTLGGGDRVHFDPTEADLRRVRVACATLARMLFEVGAKEVWPGIHGLPPVLTHVDQVRVLEEGPVDPRAYGFVASHLFGAARMGRDPASSAVTPSFETREVSKLYVVDSSVFPSNLGVNPQHGIMALSRLASTWIAERARGRDVA